METRSRSVKFVITYLLLFYFFTVASCGELPKPKNVEVSIVAKWEGTPLLLEAGELIAKEWRELFWDFIDGWFRVVDSHNGETLAPKECFQIIAKHGRLFLDEPLASVFESSLALRSASPRLVMYGKLADEALSSFPLSDDENESSTFNPPIVGSNSKSSGGHCCWVDTGGALFFEAAKLSHWLQQNSGSSADLFQPPEVFDFDHVYPFWNNENPTAVLYGAYGTECFREFHTFLVEAAKEGRVKYVLRPLLPSGCEDKAGVCSALGSGGKIYLGGYGVELALKNMEYKAMDDRAVRKGVTLEDPQTEDLSQEVRGFIFSKILERKPELKSEIMTFRDYLLSSTISDSLDVWELKDLGHQTVQRIVHATDPLLSMLEINQNFPSVVSSLSRTKVDNSIRDEISSNQRKFPGGKCLMALNGALVNVDDIDLYTMIDQVQQELVLANEFAKLKVPHKTIRTLLSTLPPTESNMLRVDYRSEHVIYINNIEEDAMYNRWRSNINEILMPVFPGQLRYIRKNLFHAVYVLDPATRCGLESINSMITLYESNYPMRFGLLFYSSKAIKEFEMGNGASSVLNMENFFYTDVSTLIMRLFTYTKESYGIQLALQFLKNLSKLQLDSTDITNEVLDMHQVEEAFVEALLPKSKSLPQDILSKLEKDREFLESCVDSSLFVFNLGISKLKCSLMLNGIVVDVTEEALVNSMNDELPRIQEGVYYGQINSRTDVLDKFLSESSVKRYNPEITADAKDKKMFISLASIVNGGESVFKMISYLHSPKSSDAIKAVSHILTVNITSKNGAKLILEGIRFLIDGSETSRIGVFFVTDSHIDVLSLQFVNIFETFSSLYSHKTNVLYFLEKLCLLFEKMRASSEAQDMTQSFLEEIKELAAEYEFSFGDLELSSKASSVGEKQKYSDQLSKYLRINLSGSPINSVITNGRVISVEGSFLKSDFLLLEAIEFRKRVKHIAETFENVDWDGLNADAVTSNFISDVIMHVSSALSKRDRNSEGARFELLDADHSAVIVKNENSSVHIDAIIDPLSAAGQKLAPVLLFLQKCIQPSMRILLNPLSSLADLPLKNYYRYVLPSMDDFNGAKAFFANMPLSKTLTMNLDVPEPWLIEPIMAVHDLDNILLENLVDTRTLKAVFELEALVLTGHCSEKDHDYPRGLQLILGTKSTPHIVDTLVMSNLGYWQMKALPGVFYLQLAPGRSSELYMLEEDAETSQNLSMSKCIIIDDLRGKVVHFNVLKKRGMENEKLLMAHDNNAQTTGNDGWNSNLLKWASGFIPGGRQSTKTGKVEVGSVSRGRKGKTINIFSIASGHLYERFLKIMILSVLKNTKRPVKFWFIKNYLSPQFKDLIPHMAHQYDFEYELITYKWPTWLHKQKEKQRIIWAYKILFLDVIFPLSLERVIFVDADQVVRADMGELYDMDIKGRPLAYTPFCDNNKDMDGYRFWRQGFWRDHLRGRPYHISALYIVDLRKFRETAAGDHLRIFYENLSKDPNSLSNLDQDLPNYAQHQVPIFSLPQEWLWCESWCGNATKSKAKTIDLCNNPMTKEPKLQGAKRIVSEWVDLDFEARKFTATLFGDDLDDFQEPPPKSLAPDDDLESKSEL